jgi:hypothetical protein
MQEGDAQRFPTRTVVDETVADRWNPFFLAVRCVLGSVAADMVGSHSRHLEAQSAGTTKMD